MRTFIIMRNGTKRGLKYTAQLKFSTANDAPLWMNMKHFILCYQHVRIHLEIYIFLLSERQKVILWIDVNFDVMGM